MDHRFVPIRLADKNIIHRELWAWAIMPLLKLVAFIILAAIFVYMLLHMTLPHNHDFSGRLGLLCVMIFLIVVICGYLKKLFLLIVASRKTKKYIVNGIVLHGPNDQGICRIQMDKTIVSMLAPKSKQLQPLINILDNWPSDRMISIEATDMPHIIFALTAIEPVASPDAPTFH